MGRQGRDQLEKWRESRIGEERLNNQGCLMKIIEYNGANDIVVEFQDEYKGKVHTKYTHFLSGGVKNPYFHSVYGMCITGNKYPIRENGKQTKEYISWNNMLKRCFDKRVKDEHPTYENVECCEEWLYYPNFYEWLHSQENFEKWYKSKRWHLDKDILVKGNRIYSPETCCLVPNNVNTLFIKPERQRGLQPIGVSKVKNGFQSWCNNPFTNSQESLGNSYSSEKAFYKYKSYKEDLIKKIANIEYNSGNITKHCYEAMMNYEVEITD
jgi:hypothetical protein